MCTVSCNPKRIGDALYRHRAWNLVWKIWYALNLPPHCYLTTSNIVYRSDLSHQPLSHLPLCFLCLHLDRDRDNSPIGPSRVWKPASVSSAVSAGESSYKKHLLHLVSNMALWKIHAGECAVYIVRTRCQCMRRSMSGCSESSRNLTQRSITLNHLIILLLWGEVQIGVPNESMPEYWKSPPFHHLQHYDSLPPQVCIDSIIGKAIAGKKKYSDKVGQYRSAAFRQAKRRVHYKYHYLFMMK